MYTQCFWSSDWSWNFGWTGAAGPSPWDPISSQSSMPLDWDKRPMKTQGMGIWPQNLFTKSKESFNNCWCQSKNLPCICNLLAPKLETVCGFTKCFPLEARLRKRASHGNANGPRGHSGDDLVGVGSDLARIGVRMVKTIFISLDNQLLGETK